MAYSKPTHLASGDKTIPEIFVTPDITAVIRPDAWAQAQARYIKGLNAEEMELYTKASLENILYEADAAQKHHQISSGSRRLIEKLQPLVEGISQYSSALDVFSNTSSLIMCPLWGSMRVLLHLAREFGKYFERLVDMFLQINDILPRFRSYEKLFSSHTRVVRAISDVYLDILKFCVSAKAVFQKAAKSPFLTTAGIGLKLSWRPFEQQYGETLDGFMRHQVKVEKELEMAHRVENMSHQAMTKEMQEKLEDMEESRIQQMVTLKEMEWFKSLRTSDYEFNKDKNPERVPGTCEWLLGHKKYTAWLDTMKSRMIIVSADPGCGKSVLSRFLLDSPDLANFDPNGALCYFFFKDDSEESRSAHHALSAILYQLFYQKRYLMRVYAEEFLNIEDERGPPSFNDLWSILTKASSDTRLSGITCVLDGLDECADETRFRFIQKLSEFARDPANEAKIKFLITTRPYNHIRNTFRKHGVDIHNIQIFGENATEKEEISTEIGLVISEKIRQFHEMRRWNDVEDNAHELLAQRLAGIENRTYLWVALIFPELEMYVGASKRDLVAVLDTLPNTVTEAYEKILNRSLNRVKAKRLLHIVIGAMRPLSLPELNLAMSIDEGDSSVSEICLTPSQSFPSLIRDLCGLFVEIIRGHVYLVHQTAKDFLQSIGEASLSLEPIPHPRWENSLRAPESHRILACICLWYLSLNTFTRDMSATISSKRASNRHRARSKLVLERPKIDFVEEHGFLTYANTYWETHYGLAGGDSKLDSLRERYLCFGEIN